MSKQLPSRKRMRAGLRRLIRCDSGGASLEFAVAAIALMTLLVGTLEFGRLMWQRSTLQFAVEETGRYAMTNTTATTVQLETAVRERAYGIEPDELVVAITSEVSGGVNFKIIKADYVFRFLTGLVDFGPITLQGRSRVPVG